MEIRVMLNIAAVGLNEGVRTDGRCKAFLSLCKSSGVWILEKYLFDVFFKSALLNDWAGWLIGSTCSGRTCREKRGYHPMVLSDELLFSSILYALSEWMKI
jgi:hypothetical protein